MDEFQTLLSHISSFKYIKINTNEYCITQLVEDLEWLSKTISFTKAFSEYLVYCNKPTNSAFLECAKISGSEALGYRGNSENRSLEFPISSDTEETVNLRILENTPFLKYKETVKEKYRHLLHILKQVYKNALVLPDVERVMQTITTDFNLESELYLKNPEFIMDDFIYHIYNHNNIFENYDKVVTILKAFEYLYYKTMNYVNELEFDAEAMKPLI